MMTKVKEGKLIIQVKLRLHIQISITIEIDYIVIEKNKISYLK
jgi:hypothetical protein